MSTSSEQQLRKWLFRGVAVLLSASPPAVLLWATDSIAERLQGVPLVHIVQAAAVMLAVILFLGAYILLQRPWLRWDEPTGTWISRLSRIRYCEKCRSKKIVTPLKNEITGWRCMSCERWYADPARRDIEPAKKSKANARI